MTPIYAKNNTASDIVISDLYEFTMTTGEEVLLTEYFDIDEIENSSNLQAFIAASEILIRSSATGDYLPPDQGITQSETVTKYEVEQMVRSIEAGGLDVTEGSSDGESFTSSQSYKQKIRLNLTGMTTGRYRIGWYYEWQIHSSMEFFGRVRLDDNTILSEHSEKPKNAKDEYWFPVNGFMYVNLTAGDHFVDIDYCSGKKNKSAGIRRARIDAWRVS